MNIYLQLVLLSTLAISALAQSSTVSVPRFEDYKVSQIYKGTPAPPRIETPSQRMYRTVIRQGIARGWGVFRDGKEQAGPNFAGHFIVVQWGCGTSCVMMVIVDTLTGKIYDIPLGFGKEAGQRMLLPGLGLRPAEVEFRLTSQLWRMDACPDQPHQEHARCYSYYYLWQGNNWRLLRRVRLEDNEF